MTDSLQVKDIAVLSACHNRRELTLSCLRLLYQQQVPAGYRMRVLLVDDGSSDGTSDAVEKEFPQVTLIRGDGSNFFFHSLYLAWNAARPADFYLWLNDDTDLRPGALQTLVDVYEASADPRTIVVGGCCDPHTGKSCTGGIRRYGWYDSEVMTPNGDVQMCDTMNGNIVLVPRQAEEAIGMLNDRFTHMFGDADYGLRARKAGIPVLLAPRHLGATELNSLKGTTLDLNLGLRQRWKGLMGPKGHRPPRQWWTYVRAHAPRPKVFYFAVPYAACLAEAVMGNKVTLRREMRTPMDRTFE
jgi:GT2 family glycosyltransferase